MTTESERYTQSSPDGTPIPFDIGYPYGLVTIGVGVAASAPVELPADALLAVLHTSCDCVVSFGADSPSASPSVAEGAFLPNQVFMPANSTLSVQVPELFVSCISADGATIGKLRVCLFKPWQGLSKVLLGSNM